MSFTSVAFLFFFLPFCVMLYYLFLFIEKRSAAIKKYRIKDIFVLFCSVVFYGFADLDSIAWITAATVLTYVCVLLIKHSSQKMSRFFCISGIILLLGSLFYYKYAAYIGSLLSFTVRGGLSALGISFITFSAISCIVDTYRGKCGNTNFLDFALYITFFGKVISGPIIFWRDFSSQLSRRVHSTDTVIKGINSMIIGLSKKLIIADTLGALAAQLSGNTTGGIDTATAWGVALIYTLQIYYDFSGYSDIALGLCRIFGFEFSCNFNFPYVSLSITEFWRRWHISLGAWFKEYLYIPLGGNRKGSMRTLANLSIVFVATGVWHGAGIAYLAWGCLHGLFMIIERLTKDKQFYKKIPAPVKWLVTMFVVMIGWQFFRLGSFSKTLEFTALMFGISDGSEIFASFSYYFTPKIITLFVIGNIGALFFDKKPFTYIKDKFYTSKPLYIIGQCLLLCLFVLSVMFMENSTYSPFIYFQY